MDRERGLFHGEGVFEQLGQLFKDGGIGGHQTGSGGDGVVLKLLVGLGGEPDDGDVGESGIALQFLDDAAEVAMAKRQFGNQEHRLFASYEVHHVGCHRHGVHTPAQIGQPIGNLAARQEGLVKDNGQRFGHGEGWSGRFLNSRIFRQRFRDEPVNVWVSRCKASGKPLASPRVPTVH